jgi:hypothetical protein
VKKAQQLMQTVVGIATLSERFFGSISKELQREILDELDSKKTKLENEIFDLLNLNLATNLNLGQTQMTQEEVKRRFATAIELEYGLALLEAEIEVKTASYNKYFVVDVEDAKETSKVD